VRLLAAGLACELCVLQGCFRPCVSLRVAAFLWGILASLVTRCLVGGLLVIGRLPLARDVQLAQLVASVFSAALWSDHLACSAACLVAPCACLGLPAFLAFVDSSIGTRKTKTLVVAVLQTTQGAKLRAQVPPSKVPKKSPESKGDEVACSQEVAVE
jgi:hypothetical protein